MSIIINYVKIFMSSGQFNFSVARTNSRMILTKICIKISHEQTICFNLNYVKYLIHYSISLEKIIISCLLMKSNDTLFQIQFAF